MHIIVKGFAHPVLVDAALLFDSTFHSHSSPAAPVSSSPAVAATSASSSLAGPSSTALSQPVPPASSSSTAHMTGEVVVPWQWCESLTHWRDYSEPLSRKVSATPGMERACSVVI